ncbi:pentapeptide repeat-containing protein [Almyronema epifaneia]|uniref:Pentapeptide repeat-containing protein n=1 Tax=Almyronema epifaneia S1 TaxID=2991925 RepID=A0ABW6ICE7_9CYAN
MRERFKQWRQTIKINQGVGIGAIATPIILAMAWWLHLLPEHKFQPDHGRLPPHKSAALASPHREPFIKGIGAIAAVAGGGFLLLKLRLANSNAETADLSGANLSGVNLCGVDLSGADLSGADLCNAVLSGANLSRANLNGANLIRANLSGANLIKAEFRYANLSGADLRYTNLSGADLRHANLSEANLNCVLLSEANFSEANLSNALLFFINLREVLNLEPLQLEAKPSPFLCNVALPAYSQQPDINPNRSCDRIPPLLSDRYGISLEEAQEIVYEARQHHWD